MKFSTIRFILAAIVATLFSSCAVTKNRNGSTTFGLDPNVGRALVCAVNSGMHAPPCGQPPRRPMMANHGSPYRPMPGYGQPPRRPTYGGGQPPRRSMPSQPMYRPSGSYDPYANRRPTSGGYSYPTTMESNRRYGYMPPSGGTYPTRIGTSSGGSPMYRYPSTPASRARYGD